MTFAADLSDARSRGRFNFLVTAHTHTQTHTPLSLLLSQCLIWCEYSRTHSRLILARCRQDIVPLSPLSPLVYRVPLRLPAPPTADMTSLANPTDSWASQWLVEIVLAAGCFTNLWQHGVGRVCPHRQHLTQCLIRSCTSNPLRWIWIW